MIFTEQKPLEEILENLGDARKVFLIGCGTCATGWHTGGEQEIKELTERLEAAGKQVLGYTIPEEACDERKTKKEVRTAKAIADADAVLVTSCGSGVQTVAMQIENKPVYPVLNSLYLGRLQRLTKSDERCVLCGDCILASTGAICPLATCAKGLLNGACGGSMHGTCEVDPDKECAWTEIYKRLEKIGQLDKLSAYQEPKDHKKSLHPRRIEKVA